MKENENSLENKEALLPIFLEDALLKKEISLTYQLSKGTWIGMTYKEDKPLVVNALKDMTEEGLYPQPLWKNI